MAAAAPPPPLVPYLPRDAAAPSTSTDSIGAASAYLGWWLALAPAPFWGAADSPRGADLAAALDAYLLAARRPHDDVVEAGGPVPAALATLHRRALAALARLADAGEPGAPPPAVRAATIARRALLPLARVLDAAAVFGPGAAQETARVVNAAFAAAPALEHAIEAALPDAVMAMDGARQALEDAASPAAVAPPAAFLRDAVHTLAAIAAARPAAAEAALATGGGAAAGVLAAAHDDAVPRAEAMVRGQEGGSDADKVRVVRGRRVSPPSRHYIRTSGAPFLPSPGNGL